MKILVIIFFIAYFIYGGWIFFKWWFANPNPRWMNALDAWFFGLVGYILLLIYFL